MSRTILRSLSLLVALVAPVTSAHATSIREILAANKEASDGSALDGKQTLKLSYGYSGQGLKGRTSSRVKAKTPIGMPSRSIGTPRMVRKPPNLWASDHE